MVKGTKQAAEHIAKRVAARSATMATRPPQTAWNKGQSQSEEVKAKIAAAHRGKKLSAEHRAKLAAVLREVKPDNVDHEIEALDPRRDPKDTIHRGLWLSNLVHDKKRKAKVRDIPWMLTKVEAAKLLMGSCYYCGYKGEINQMGIDRIDNTKGYVDGNCRSCCFPCNSAKGVMGETEFYAWIDRIYSYSFHACAVQHD